MLEQVDQAETGVVTGGLLDALGELAAANPGLPVIADSRRGLRGWPRRELQDERRRAVASLSSRHECFRLDDVAATAAEFAVRNGRPVFVTLSERGMVAADPRGSVEHVAALPVRGPIDIVGAGDSVTANLAAALAGGASLREATELAAVASSLVIHQLGTTGTASVRELAHHVAPKN